MTDAIKLLNCPFCGGEADWDPDYPAVIVCENECCIMQDDTPEKAAFVWNRRAAGTCEDCKHCETFRDCCDEYESRCGRYNFHLPDDETFGCNGFEPPAEGE